jgi:hypothetical protein
MPLLVVLLLVLALVSLGRDGLTLATPALWPHAQSHYYVWSLRTIRKSRILALATSVNSSAPLGVLAVANLRLIQQLRAARLRREAIAAGLEPAPAETQPGSTWLAAGRDSSRPGRRLRGWLDLPWILSGLSRRAQLRLRLDARRDHGQAEGGAPRRSLVTRPRIAGGVREGFEPLDEAKQVRHFGLAQIAALESHQEDAFALPLVGFEQRLDETGLVELPFSLVPGLLSMEEHRFLRIAARESRGCQSDEIVRPSGSKRVFPDRTGRTT